MLIFAFFFGLFLQVAVTEIVFFEVMFETVGLSFAEWGRLLVLATVPLWFHELRVLFFQLKEKRRNNLENLCFKKKRT